jgi:hypothetical protein
MRRSEVRGQRSELRGQKSVRGCSCDRHRFINPHVYVGANLVFALIRERPFAGDVLMRENTVQDGTPDILENTVLDGVSQPRSAEVNFYVPSSRDSRLVNL